MSADENKQVIEDIWSSHPDSFMKVRHSSQEHVLHPTLARLINEQQPNNLLDFGCGDGRILTQIDPQIVVDVHDCNEPMLSLAKQRNGARIRTCFLLRDQIPSSQYESVLLSMVLMTIDNEAEHQSVLKSVTRILRDGGRSYIAISHPCFRDRQFSNFRTSFGSEQSYEYLKLGTPFTVYLEDDAPPQVAFIDFHWPLSYTLNGIIEAGMSITNVIETSDDSSSLSFNSEVSPFVIIEAEKRRTT